MVSNVEIILRLLLASALGGLIGMEREASNRPAGLRTHILVAVGSALIMLVSIDGFRGISYNGSGADPSRLAAQIVTGIGFLGAGTILTKGSSIHGLTTAASLWVCGGIGIAIGGGYYLGGVVTVIIVLFTLSRLSIMEKNLFKQRYRMFIVDSIDRTGLIGELGTVFGACNMNIRSMDISHYTELDDLEYIKIKFLLRVPSNFESSGQCIFDSIYKVKGVKKAEWETKKIYE